MSESKEGKYSLSDILVITTRKSFWASPQSSDFPNILYTWIFFGKSSNFINSVILFLRSLLFIFFKHPKLVLVGSAPRLNPWFAKLKKYGLLKNTLLACIGHLEFGYYLVPYFDRIFVYSKRELDIRDSKAPVKGRYCYIPLPASRVEDRAFSEKTERYIFSGGRAKRDYKTLIKAVQDMDVKVRIVTRDRECVDWEGQLPGNVKLEFFKPLDEFLQDVKDSLFVVIPLFREEEWSHGQTTIVQSMRLGKAIISNTEATVEDYIDDGENGILVEPENVDILKKAIDELLNDEKEIERLGSNAREKSSIFTDSYFVEKLKKSCLSLMNQG